MQKPKLPVQQLTILAICRFAEPIAFTSILPYMPELIEYVGVPEPEVAKWAGIASAVASISQAVMAVPWGTLSDYIGRKPVLISGLMCTMIFSIMLGMSQSLTMVLLTRTLIGFFNGNVGIYRTIVAEIVPERELQPRAFSLMPLVWTVGSIFGPSFGGALARPVEKYPDIFGRFDILRRNPFLLPNLVSAIFFVIGITNNILFLRETLEAKKNKPDYGRQLGEALVRPCTSCRKRREDAEASDEERTSLIPRAQLQKQDKKAVPRPEWSQIFTPQSIFILISYTMVSGLGMAFDAVFPAFLSYPEQKLHGNPEVKLPFKFAGGFGIDSQTIGMYYTITGIIGMIIQFYAFPPIVKRLGTLQCFKYAAIAMPIVFFLTPFLVLVPEPFRLTSVLSIMLAKLGVIIFRIPCCTILLTNSATSMIVLGTLNGVGTSVSALGRAGGPALIGAAFSFGVKRGYVIIPWWLLSSLALFSIVPAFWIVEQDGPHRDSNAEEEDNEDEAEEQEASITVRNRGYGTVESNSKTIHEE